MGGTIDFASTVGVGSTFWIDFPLAGATATVVEIPNRASMESHLPDRRRITFLAEAGAATEFLRTAIAEARAEASEGLSADEHTDVASNAVADLVESRIDERQLVATIRSTLADKRRNSEGERHVV